MPPIKQHTIPVFLLYEWSQESIKGNKREKGYSDFFINVLDVNKLEVKTMRGKNLYTKDQYTIDGKDYGLEMGFAKLEADISGLVRGINYSINIDDYIKSDYYQENVINLMKYYLIKSRASESSKIVSEWYGNLKKGASSSEINAGAKQMLDDDMFVLFEKRVEKIILLENQSPYSFPAISNIGIMMDMDIIIPVGPFRAIKFVMYKNVDKFIVIPKFSKYILKRNKDVVPMFDKFYQASGGKIVIGNERKPYFASQGFASRLSKFARTPLPKRTDVVPFGTTEAYKYAENMFTEIDEMIDELSSENVKAKNFRSDLLSKYGPSNNKK